MEQNFTFGMLVKIIRKRFLLLVGIAIIAAIGAAIFSSPAFIPPKYKSEAIVYPINLEPYSNESRTELLLQIAMSSSIRDSIIDKFDLAEVYELDPGSEGFKHSLYSEYNDNVVVSRTNYESVRIEVLNEDPVRAKEMADELILQINYKGQSLSRKKAIEHLGVARNQMDYQQQVLDSINGLLSELRTNNQLLDYQIQTERITEGYLKMLATANVRESRLEEVRSMLDDLGEKGGIFMALSQMSELGHENYNELFNYYQGILKEVNQQLSYTNVVSSPEVADKKAYPVRWLILVTTVVSTLLISLIIMLLFEKRIEKA